MCTACENLIKAIDRYIEKANDKLIDQLTDAGFLDARETIRSIEELEDMIAEVLQKDTQKILSAMNEYKSFEDFIKQSWPKLKDDEETIGKLNEIFKKQFQKKISDLVSVYASSVDTEILTDTVSHQTTAWIARWSGQLAEMMKLNDNTVIERILSAGMKNGDSVQTVAQKIQDSGLRDSQGRARRVAVTEMLRAHNVAASEAYMQSPAVSMKMWKHSGVGNPPRENHVAMDGQKVNKSEAFILMGQDGGIYRPMYPMDPSLPAAETVNCRCTAQPVVDDSVLGMPAEERQRLRDEALADMDADFDAQLDHKRMQELVDTGLFEWTPDGRNIQNAGSGALLNKEGDPLLDILGSISESNPAEMNRIIGEAKRKGVEVRDSEHGMAYSPGLKPGEPGQLHISEGDSLGAWKHEERHMLDDEKHGWLGFEGLMQIDVRAQMEYNAYNEEIRIALNHGSDETADKLRELCREEIERFGGEWDEDRIL